ncbi:hypothetical protein DCCM_0347 [Desulfocucumis palustris]|uniref:Uncharacterized protein n=1 Tax=Desulfocucumis palustris TaxID=1898651 RepID=A0A2L2XD51_9FIRM|nr:hypothetical protein DCCM_0347 [Desulfocucumis palustris]
MPAANPASHITSLKRRAGVLGMRSPSRAIKKGLLLLRPLYYSTTLFSNVSSRML